MQRVIIADVRSHTIDGSIKGHGYAVASNYLEIFKGVAEVKVAGGSAYAQRYGDQAIALPNDALPSRPGWLNKLCTLQNMHWLFSHYRKDTIVLQSSGVVTALLGLALFKHAETRVFMILYNTEVMTSCVKRFFLRLAKRRIAGILCPNSKVGKAHNLPYCTIPDYIYCGEENTLRAQPISYEDKKYDFCMVGIIWRDKGMVEAARHLAGTPHKVLIAGALSGEEGLEEDLRAACRGTDNIDLRIGYLSAEEYDAAIRNSRYCILNYSAAYSEHTSGVVFDILFRGVPIVGRSCSSLHFIADYGIGQLYEEITAFAPASVLNAAEHARFLENMQHYFETHRAYRDKLIRFVTGASQASPSPALSM